MHGNPWKDTTTHCSGQRQYARQCHGLAYSKKQPTPICSAKTFHFEHVAHKRSNPLAKLQSFAVWFPHARCIVFILVSCGFHQIPRAGGFQGGVRYFLGAIASLMPTIRMPPTFQDLLLRFLPWWMLRCALRSSIVDLQYAWCYPLVKTLFRNSRSHPKKGSGEEA